LSIIGEEVGEAAIVRLKKKETICATSPPPLLQSTTAGFSSGDHGMTTRGEGRAVDAPRRRSGTGQ